MPKPHTLPTVFSSGNVAVITGAASGIGLAAARRFAALGMKLVMADLGGATLERAAEEVARIATSDVIAAATDVAQPEQLVRLAAEVARNFGPVSVLMNNAGVGNNPGLPWENVGAWQELFDVNLWGVVSGVQAFVPAMLASEKPAMVINTGSKQGITSPPGNSAYNMSKAALKNYTESLAHALRGACGSRISAHLLIPGFTYTGMTGATEKPVAAWTGEQVVAFMLESLTRGDFYILCPDNAVDRGVDEKRIQWSADDLILNRPALSRWHPDFEAEFAKYMSGAAAKSGG
jgi:NAD(P)-dependent dehydrogenase (short-subunit alcohol dehydrogenase family)